MKLNCVIDNGMSNVTVTMLYYSIGGHLLRKSRVRVRDQKEREEERNALCLLIIKMFYLTKQDKINCHMSEELEDLTADGNIEQFAIFILIYHYKYFTNLSRNHTIQCKC